MTGIIARVLVVLFGLSYEYVQRSSKNDIATPLFELCRVGSLFERAIKHRPRIRLMLMRVVEQGCGGRSRPCNLTPFSNSSRQAAGAPLWSRQCPHPRCPDAAVGPRRVCLLAWGPLC